MFQALPADTVFEARKRTKRRTALLFLALFAIYAVFFNLIAFVLFHTTLTPSGIFARSDALLFIVGSTLAGILVAWLHFLSAQSELLEKLLKDLRTVDADPEDECHRQFLNIVKEAEAASGIRPIRAVVILTAGANAFALADGSGRAAIGVTEGLLLKLDRSELSAVIAHETAHLIHGDSRLITIACSLSAVFGQISNTLLSEDKEGNFGLRLSRGTTMIWLAAILGKLFTKLLSLAIFRDRELLADCDAVHICQDPLSLADGLRKISTNYRGNLWIPENFSAAFIMNPTFSAMDEQNSLFSELFSTHPPVSERTTALLGWAKAKLDAVKTVPNQADNSHPEAAYHVYQQGSWTGPMTPDKLLNLGAVSPSTWVTPAQSDELPVRASQVASFKENFKAQIGSKASPWHCPRCDVALIEDFYEGVPVFSCTYCLGRLFKKKDAVEKIVIRRFATFSETEAQKTTDWRKLQRGSVQDLCRLPTVTCPLCLEPMWKTVHLEVTRVVIDCCSNPGCGAVWCDANEIEKIQMIIENFEKQSKA